MRNPFLVLFSILAVIIGVYCGNAIRRSGARSSTSALYALTRVLFVFTYVAVIQSSFTHTAS